MRHGIDGGCGKRRSALAAALAFAGATIAAPPAIAAVANCNDAGTGSLRKAVADATSGATIDLSALTCSTITLTTGAILVDVNNLTLRGADLAATFIDAGDNSRVFNHTGSGLLVLQDLTVRHGTVNGADGGADGGCIYSKGSVKLDHALVKYCTAHASYDARGGGIYAQHDVTMYTSSVRHSQAIADTTGIFVAPQGGGVFAQRAFVAKYSTISGNSVVGPSGKAGGVSALGNATINHSTISGNSAAIVGGAYLYGRFATKKLRISNSTISGNTATNSEYGSGLLVGYPLVLSSSTITRNIETNPGHDVRGAGLFVYGYVAIEIESSIIGGNLLSGGFGTPSDLGGKIPTSPVTGADNLISQSSLGVPSDTISGQQPGLASLGNNGGPTATHMPLADSPAIDAGNNVFNADNDQRGAGHPREINGRADIGAVERNDEIFADGFD